MTQPSPVEQAAGYRPDGLLGDIAGLVEQYGLPVEDGLGSKVLSVPLHSGALLSALVRKEGITGRFLVEIRKPQLPGEFGYELGFADGAPQFFRIELGGKFSLLEVNGPFVHGLYEEALRQAYDAISRIL